MGTSTLIPRLWNYSSILPEDGMSYGDYVEQFSYQQFLMMADERSRPPYYRSSAISGRYAWPTLRSFDDHALGDHCHHTLSDLGRQTGTLALICGKAHKGFQDPAKLRRAMGLGVADCIGTRPGERVRDPA